MKARAAVILIENNKIAMIERHRAGRHYIVFPGGKIQFDETPEAAAKREIMEELGLDVNIDRLVAEVWYMYTPQYYFLAKRIGGEFGSGTGKEMTSLPDSPKGSHQPIWLPVDKLLTEPVYPKTVAKLISKSYPNNWPPRPLGVKDEPPDE